MLRALLFIAKLAVVVAVAVVLAYQPSRVTIELFDHKIETSVGILVLVVALISVVATLSYRYWRLLLGAPGNLGRVIRESRRRRGYKALTQGMVAVAAGDPDEARRWARKAEVLMEEPPLTLLLSAQAAQLNGDEQAARRYFEAMLEREETRFMGLRGCLMQAMRQGDNQAALSYLRDAHAMRPKTPWVLTAMIDLSETTGDFGSAEAAIKRAVRHKALPAAEGERKRAVVLLERAKAARSTGDGEQARKLAQAARKLAPALVPATVMEAELLIAGGHHSDALRLLQRAWPAQPHPDLARLYRSLAPNGDRLAEIARLGKLVAGAPDHPESRIALAEAALDAQLWGEARRYLGAAAGDAPSERICRLMARLEETEHGDGAKARNWLLKAGTAPRDPAWVCRTCGALARQWDAHCGACRSFDGLDWRRPVQVAAEPLPGDVAAGNAAPRAELASPGGNGSSRAVAPREPSLPDRTLDISVTPRR